MNIDPSTEKAISSEKVFVHDKSDVENGEVVSPPAGSLRGNGHGGQGGTQRRLRNYQVTVRFI